MEWENSQRPTRPHVRTEENPIGLGDFYCRSPPLIPRFYALQYCYGAEVFYKWKSTSEPKAKELGITLKNKSFLPMKDINDALFSLSLL